MKPFVVAFTLAAVFVPSASFGDSPAGIAGSVIDAGTGRPLAGIAVEIARQDGRELRMVVTDKHGYFVILGLEPDRYVATARDATAASTCRIEDVASGQMRRLQIVVGTNQDTTCATARPPGSLLDPDETADVYRIH